MFSHQGRNRTLKHNLRIATILSFVAGIVNVTGFLFLGQLTTNVTGHFAQFMNELLRIQPKHSLVYLLYILSFLLGATFSGIMMDRGRRLSKQNIYQTPLILEGMILICLPILLMIGLSLKDDMVACILLFSMGMQNSYVTHLSGAVVRTTHLTGLFTDLGIEISQWINSKLHPNTRKVKAMIKLRVRIIFSFFAGGIIGGLCYFKLSMELSTLLLGGIVLVISMLYDHHSNMKNRVHL